MKFKKCVGGTLNCVGISWKVKKVARKAVFLTREYFELFVGLIGYANAKKMSKKKMF